MTPACSVRNAVLAAVLAATGHSTALCTEIADHVIEDQSGPVKIVSYSQPSLPMWADSASPYPVATLRTARLNDDEFVRIDRRRLPALTQDAAYELRIRNPCQNVQLEVVTRRTGKPRTDVLRFQPLPGRFYVVSYAKDAPKPAKPSKPPKPAKPPKPPKPPKDPGPQAPTPGVPVSGAANAATSAVKRVQALDTELSWREQRLRELQRDIAATERKRDDVERRLLKDVKSRQTIDSAIAEKEAERAAFSTEIRALEVQARQALEKRATLDNQIAELEGALNVLARLDQNVNESASLQAVLRDKIRKVTTERNDYATAYSDCDLALQQRRAVVNKLGSEIQHLRTERGKLKIDALTGERDHHLASIRQHRKLVEELRPQILEYRSRLAEAIKSLTKP